LEILLESGLRLVQALQVYSPGLDGVMAFLSFLGTIAFYILMVPFVYWTIDRRLGIRLFQILLVALTLDLALKLVLHSPRPYWIGSVKILAEEPTYGNPSGHAILSFSVWVYLAFYIKKTWFWITAVTLVFFIGLSRVYLGVHFPHDVLVGWLLGVLVLWLFLRGEPWLARLEAQSGEWGSLWIGVGLSLVILAANQAILVWLAGIPDPSQWGAYSTLARSPGPLIEMAGLAVGAVAGYPLMRSYADFQGGGSWRLRSTRFVLGIASVLLLYFGLDRLPGILAPGSMALEYSLGYFRSLLLAFWIIVIAPWVFLRAGLAERHPTNAARGSGS
jgi:membrane-associated phospholipid phosphatase